MGLPPPLALLLLLAGFSLLVVGQDNTDCIPAVVFRRERERALQNWNLRVFIVDVPSPNAALLAGQAISVHVHHRGKDFTHQSQFVFSPSFDSYDFASTELSLHSRCVLSSRMMWCTAPTKLFLESDEQSSVMVFLNASTACSHTNPPPPPPTHDDDESDEDKIDDDSSNSTQQHALASSSPPPTTTTTTPPPLYPLQVFHGVASASRFHQPDRWVFEDLFEKPSPMKQGVFVEVGAYDGVRGSNTLFFQRHLEWTGVLVEAEPHAADMMVKTRCSGHATATSLIAANTNVSNITTITGGAAAGRGATQHATTAHNNASSVFCLPVAVCEEKDQPSVTFTGIAGMDVGGVAAALPKQHIENRIPPGAPSFPVVCVPLGPTLIELGITRIDFMSIDVEGSELAVLISMDWDEVAVYAILIDQDGIFPDRDANVRHFLMVRGFEMHGKEDTHELWVNHSNRRRVRA